MSFVKNLKKLIKTLRDFFLIIFYRKKHVIVFDPHTKYPEILNTNVDNRKVSTMFYPEYSEDGLITNHLHFFSKEKLFIESYNKAFDRKSWFNHNRWRVHVIIWAASYAKKLEGDFVECGVNTGGMAEGIINYINFEKTNKYFYLFDTYEGIPEKLISENEKKSGINVKHYQNVYDDVKNHFNKYKNVKIIKGQIPEILYSTSLNKISFLSLDTNVPSVELKALIYLWDKIIINGIIVLDDYCYSDKYRINSEIFNKFEKEKNFKILQLPTGQGIIIKT